MRRPQKKDFEYYQDGIIFKTVDLFKYSKALDEYIDSLRVECDHKVRQSAMCEIDYCLNCQRYIPE